MLHGPPRGGAQQKQNKGSLSKQVSPSLLESSRSEGLIEEDTHQARAGKEALSEDNLGKQTNHDIVDADMGKESDLAARELMGEKPARTAADTAKSKNGNNIVKGDIKNDKENVNWANLLFKNKLAREQTGVGLRTSRNDVGEMGLVNLVKGPSRTKEGVVDKLSLNPNQGINSESDTSPISGHKEKEDRGVGINPLSSIGKSLDAELEKVEDWSSASEEEESLSRAERVFFPELDSKKVNKKRYGPLMQIQGKSISEKERKKRDRAVCKEKQRTKGWDASELSGRSLSELDLVQHWEILTKRAKKALALGKRLGVEIEEAKFNAVRTLIKDQRAEMLLLQETKKDAF
ncbi:hypothetical protein V6N11_023623 [Hibiscus sabdariffa]|uniref:Uncharacterized protein n=1 Tax=Hibiscus sabdariffa TaxID=183260 RepID=A0ABR2TNN8_9ROSI